MTREIKPVQPKKRKPVRSKSVLDPDFVYTEASKTDVQKTWKRFGWVPPSEVKNAQAA